LTDTWHPSQYNKYQREREQPFYDVLALIKRAPDMVAVDLGCGTGSLTRKLHEALGARSTLGIDRSARMLDDARHSTLPPGLRFEVGDMNDFSATAAYDLIFSNAAFHWVPDHEALIGRLAAALKPGGQLAFQIPASHDTISHLVAEELTSVEPFATGFGGWHRPQPVLEPDEYARLLYRAGFPEPKVSLRVYTHMLAGPEEVVEWMKGTLLTEYERHLQPELFGEFLAAYRERLLGRLDEMRPYFFPFKRILCWGQRRGGSA
jgi:trans-aconitate 2-methyltransferase